MAPVVKKQGIFLYFFLLTVLFLVFEVSFFTQCNKVYLGDFTFVADKLVIPTTIIPDIIYFLLAQLLLHFAYCVFSWFITILVSNLFHVTSQKRFLLGVTIWVLGIITILVANQYFFPNSKKNTICKMKQ